MWIEKSRSSENYQNRIYRSPDAAIVLICWKSCMCEGNDRMKQKTILQKKLNSSFTINSKVEKQQHQCLFIPLYSFQSFYTHHSSKCFWKRDKECKKRLKICRQQTHIHKQNIIIKPKYGKKCPKLFSWRTFVFWLDHSCSHKKSKNVFMKLDIHLPVNAYNSKHTNQNRCILN